MGVGIGHDDGGMGGDDELGLLLDEVVNSSDDGELAAWRESCFRFVEEVEAFSVEAINHEGDERFAVGLFVECTLAVGWTDWRTRARFGIELFNFCRDVEEAFGSPEEAIAWARNPF